MPLIRPPRYWTLAKFFTPAHTLTLWAVLIFTWHRANWHSIKPSWRMLIFCSFWCNGQIREDLFYKCLYKDSWKTLFKVSFVHRVSWLDLGGSVSQGCWLLAALYHTVWELLQGGKYMHTSTSGHPYWLARGCKPSEKGVTKSSPPGLFTVVQSVATTERKTRKFTPKLHRHNNVCDVTML